MARASYSPVNSRDTARCSLDRNTTRKTCTTSHSMPSRALDARLPRRSWTSSRIGRRDEPPHRGIAPDEQRRGNPPDQGPVTHRLVIYRLGRTVDRAGRPPLRSSARRRRWWSAPSSGPACSLCRPPWRCSVRSRSSRSCSSRSVRVALALTFRGLAARLPGAGGPYVYARDAFGEFAGFLIAWSYWITAWAGNAAIVVAWVGYVEVFWNTGHEVGWSIVIALTGLWLPALVNLVGLRSIAAFQVVTTVLKFIPLLFMATIGLLFINTRQLRRLQRQRHVLARRDQCGGRHRPVQLPRHRDRIGRGRRGSAIRSATSVAPRFWAPWPAPRSTSSGTVTVFGTVAHDDLVGSTAPFSDSADAIFGGQWAGADGRRRSRRLRLRRARRLDVDRGRDAARSGAGRAVPDAVRGSEPRRGAHVRDRRLHPARLGTHRRQLHQLRAGVHHRRAACRCSPRSSRTCLSAAAQLYWLLTDGRRLRVGHLVRDVVVSALALAFGFWAARRAAATRPSTTECSVCCSGCRSTCGSRSGAASTARPRR